MEVVFIDKFDCKFLFNFFDILTFLLIREIFALNVKWLRLILHFTYNGLNKIRIVFYILLV